MELHFRQGVLFTRNKYDIFDENERPVFHVQGKRFTWGAKIHLYDLAGKKLYFIRQKVTFFPEYAIFQGENLCARIKTVYSLFNPRVSVESSLGNFEVTGNLEITGNLYFKILRNGQAMGEMRPPRLSWGETYVLSVYDPEDAAFFTALAIAADKCLYNNKNND